MSSEHTDAAAPAPPADLHEALESSISDNATATRTPAPTAAPQEARARAPAQSTDPQVENLAAIFPTLDLETIAIVLESNGGNVDRAAQQCLTLTGGGEPEPASPASRGQYAQEDADAAFARQLAAESDGRQQRSYAGLNYQPRVRQPAARRPQHGIDVEQVEDELQPQRQGGLSQGGREDVDRAVQTVKDAASAAGRTAVGFFNQLKTKVNEMQAQRASGSSPTPEDSEDPARGTASAYSASAPAPAPAPAAAPRRTSSGPAPTSNPNKFAPALKHANRYRPQAATPTFTSGQQPPTQKRDLANIKARANASTGADAFELPSPTIDAKAEPSTAPAPKPSEPNLEARKRISLLGPTAPAKPTPAREDSDNESLEYTRSPFEDE